MATRSSRKDKHPLPVALKDVRATQALKHAPFELADRMEIGCAAD
jgi:hypothetical protein